MYVPVLSLIHLVQQHAFSISKHHGRRRGREGTYSAPATDDVRMTRLTVSFDFTTEPSTFCTAAAIGLSVAASAEHLCVHGQVGMRCALCCR